MKNSNHTESKRLAGRPYTPVIRDEEGTWVAEYRELSGCMAVGRTREEAVRKLKEAAVDWIAFALDHGFPVPAPQAVASSR